MNRTVLALGALVAAALLIPADAFAQRGGFGGGVRSGGGGFGGMRAAGGGYRGSYGGYRSGHRFYPMVRRHAGAGHGFRHGFRHGYRRHAPVIHGVRHGHHRHFFPHHKRFFGRHPAFFRHGWGRRPAYWSGYVPYYPYGYGAIVATVATSYDDRVGYPFYGAVPYYGAPGYPAVAPASPSSCPMLIRRVVEPSGQVVIHKRSFCP